MNGGLRRAVPDNWMTDVASALAAAVARAPWWTLAAVVVALPFAAVGGSMNAVCIASGAGGVVATALAARPARQIIWPAIAGLLVFAFSIVAVVVLEPLDVDDFLVVRVAAAGVLIGAAFGLSGLARASARRPWLSLVSGVLAVSFMAAFGTVVVLDESRLGSSEGLARWVMVGVFVLGVCGVTLLVALDGTWVRWIAYTFAGYALHKLGGYDAAAIAGAIAIAVLGGRAARVARLERPEFDEAVTSFATRVSLRPWRTAVSIALVTACVWFTLVELRSEAVSEIWSNDGRPDSPYPSVWAAFGALPTAFLAAAVATQAALQRSSQLVERLVPWIAFGVGAAAFVFALPYVQDFLSIGSDVAIVYERWMVPVAFAAMAPGALVATRPPHGRIGWLEAVLFVVTVLTVVTAGLAAHEYREKDLFGLLYYVAFLAVAGWYALIMRTAATLTSVRRMWLFALIATILISAGLLTFVDDVLVLTVAAGFTALHMTTGVCAVVLVRRLRCVTPLAADHPARRTPE